MCAGFTQGLGNCQRRGLTLRHLRELTRNAGFLVILIGNRSTTRTRTKSLDFLFEGSTGRIGARCQRICFVQLYHCLSFLSNQPNIITILLNRVDYGLSLAIFEFIILNDGMDRHGQEFEEFEKSSKKFLATV
jgi:hypothetical protein